MDAVSLKMRAGPSPMYAAVPTSPASDRDPNTIPNLDFGAAAAGAPAELAVACEPDVPLGAVALPRLSRSLLANDVSS